MDHEFPTILTNRDTAPLKEIPYLDHPELKFNEHESTQMPFRYVKGEDGQPVMPEVSSCSRADPLRVALPAHRSQGMVDLIRKDSDKAIDDMF